MSKEVHDFRKQRPAKLHPANIFDRFQVPLPSSDGVGLRKFLAMYGVQLPPSGGMALEKVFEQFNLIGFDFGDAEITAVRVFLDNNIPNTVQLSFNHFGKQYAPNIIAFSNGQARLVEETTLGRGEVYSNFKYCPEDPHIYNPYKQGALFTNGELMGHCFAAALKCLFENNPALDLNKPTIIMVGRPASPLWAEAEVKYTEILGMYVKDYINVEKPISILAVGESCAAMAGALGMNQEAWQNQVVQILDLGSSTFDSFIITPDGVPDNAEDSYQFGGNLLDKTIERFGDEQYIENYPPKGGYVLGPQYGKTARLRFKKENAYGELGAAHGIVDTYLYTVYKNNHKGEPEPVYDEENYDNLTYPFKINREKIQAICTNKKNQRQLRCKTERLIGNPFRETKEHDSWMAACEYVMNQFYHDCAGHYARDGKPDKLILSGGVANMPEVRNCASVIFGVDVEVVEDPKNTVSKGLGLILGSELAKKLLVQELEVTILENPKAIPSAENLRKEIVSAACDVDLDYYEATIRKWADDPGKNTLDSCVKLLCGQDNPLFKPDQDFVGAVVIKLFEGKINAAIEQQIRKKLEKMFPNAQETFSFKIDFSGVMGLPAKKLTMLRPHIGFFFDAENFPGEKRMNGPFRKEEKQRILRVFQAHRNTLKTGGELDYGEIGALQIPGMYAHYEPQITPKEAEAYRKAIMDQLKPEICEFVEGMTYYLSIIGKHERKM